MDNSNVQTYRHIYNRLLSLAPFKNKEEFNSLIYSKWRLRSPQDVANRAYTLFDQFKGLGEDIFSSLVISTLTFDVFKESFKDDWRLHKRINRVLLNEPSVKAIISFQEENVNNASVESEQIFSDSKNKEEHKWYYTLVKRIISFKDKVCLSRAYLMKCPYFLVGVEIYKRGGNYLDIKALDIAWKSYKKAEEIRLICDRLVDTNYRISEDGPVMRFPDGRLYYYEDAQARYISLAEFERPQVPKQAMLRSLTIYINSLIFPYASYRAQDFASSLLNCHNASDVHVLCGNYLDVFNNFKGVLRGIYEVVCKMQIYDQSYEYFQSHLTKPK